MTPLLAFEAVAAVRRDHLLFDALSFALAPGDAALVTGPNGAGKSTLIRIAAGLLSPTAGKVTRHADASLALLSEATALDPDLSLAGALGFWARLDRGTAAASAITATLAALDLEPLADVPVRLLSTGQRRRAAIARVVASAADLWLLDEPANGLDAAAITLLAATIADHRARGGAVLVATHLPLDLPCAHVLALGAA